MSRAEILPTPGDLMSNQNVAFIAVERRNNFNDNGVKRHGNTRGGYTTSS